MRIGKTGQITVQSLEIVDSGLRSKSGPDAEWKVRMEVVATGPKFAKRFYVDATYKRLLTAEQSQQVSDYQDSLTKAGKARKTKV